MSVKRSTCPQCGSAIPQSMDGLCPQCVAAALRSNDPVDERATCEDASSMEHDPTANASDTSESEFQFGRKIAQGGMGLVVEARDCNINRKVVVKFLRPDREADPRLVARFLAEARISGQLEHPSIIPVYHLGTTGEGRPFYAMRHVAGETLAEVLLGLRQNEAATLERYPLSALLSVFQKVCDAVAYAHSHGIVHRDLKPENIMIGRFGEVVVMDWGLAKRLSRSANPSIGERPDPATEGELTQTDADANRTAAPRAGMRSVAPNVLIHSSDTLDHIVLGTPGFMAPEQATGLSNQADERSDIYSLGAILYAVLTLDTPGGGTSANSILERTKEGRIPPPAEYNRRRGFNGRGHMLPHYPNWRVPLALSAVAMKAISPKPEMRYQTVLDLQKDVTAFQNGLATSAEEAGWTTRTLYWIKRHRTATTVAALILALVTAFSWRNWQTLTELRNTAPALVALAEALISGGDFAQALNHVEVALRLQPNGSHALALKGNILMAQLRLAEARVSYSRALELDPAREEIRPRLDLCDRLLASGARPSDKWPKENLVELYRGLVEHGLSAEAHEIYRRIDEADERLLDFWQSRLTAGGITNQLGWSYHRPAGLRSIQTGATNILTPESRKYLQLALQDLSVSELSPLRGLPIRELLIECPNVTDLRPLIGMPLVRLSFFPRFYGPEDFINITDLTPLSDLPLEYIHFGQARVQDLGPISKIRTLRELHCWNMDILEISPLTGLPIENLRLSSLLVTSLAPLRDMPVTSLDLSYINVVDLTPLTNLRLETLLISNLDVSDISALRGQPLRILHLHNCPLLTDVSPLEDCRTLQELVLPPNADNIEFLRHFPHLKRISYTKPLISAEEFWRAYDLRRDSRK